MRDSSARSAPRNDKNLSFSASCIACSGVAFIARPDFHRHLFAPLRPQTTMATNSRAIPQAFGCGARRPSADGDLILDSAALFVITLANT